MVDIFECDLMPFNNIKKNIEEVVFRINFYFFFISNMCLDAQFQTFKKDALLRVLTKTAISQKDRCGGTFRSKE